MAEIPLHKKPYFLMYVQEEIRLTLNFPFWIIHYGSKDLKPSTGTSDDERKACRKACQPLEKQAFATDSAIPKDDSSPL